MQLENAVKFVKRFAKNRCYCKGKVKRKMGAKFKFISIAQYVMGILDGLIWRRHADLLAF